MSKVRVCDSCGDRLWPSRDWIKVRHSLHASDVFREIVGDYCKKSCLDAQIKASYQPADPIDAPINID